MKYILVFLIAIIFSVSAEAQLKEYKGATADTFGISADVYRVFPAIEQGYRFVNSCKLTKVSASANVYAIRQYSYDGVNYTAIDSVRWYGTTADSTFSRTSIAATYYYPFVRYRFKANSGQVRLTSVKQWYFKP